MAGTRLWISTAFCVQLLALIALALYAGFGETKSSADDPLVLWWRLWWWAQQQQQQHPQDLWNELATFKTLSRPTLTIHPGQQEEWWSDLFRGDSGDGKKRKNSLNVTVLKALPSEHGDDGGSDQTCMQDRRRRYCNKDGLFSDERASNNPHDAVDLWICDHDNNSSAQALFHVHSDGTLALHMSPSSDLKHMSLEHLLLPQAPALPSQLPVQTCIEGPVVDWIFLVEEGGVHQQQSSFDDWNAWLQALQEVRAASRLSWFPISTSSSSSLASLANVHVQTVSTGNTRNGPADLPVTPHNQTTTRQLALDDVQAFLSQQDTAATMPVYLLVQTDDSMPIQLEDTPPGVDGPSSATIAVTHSAMFVVLPLFPQEVTAQHVLHRVTSWITRRCLGLPPPPKAEVEWRHDSAASLRLPQWFAKVFWHRALSELYRDAFRHARDAIQRYKRVVTAPPPDSWHAGLLSLLMISPAPPAAHAQAALQRVAQAHAAAQHGDFGRAVECLLEEIEVHAIPEEAQLPRLILDLGADQYAAILLPLLVPLLLPSLVAWMREARRWWRKRRQ